jgi:hypothetical protein
MEGIGVPEHYRKAAHLLLIAFLATACSTGPEYQPRIPGSTVGYTDLQLSPNRYRVAFQGSYYSTRDDVERYLLRRAAEVTLLSGYTHFVVQMRETERMTDYFGSPYPYGGLYYPYADEASVVSSYSSYAEILLLSAAEAANGKDVIEARAVLVSLDPQLDFSPLKTAAAPK